MSALLSDKELLEQLEKRIASNPDIVPKVLDALRDGMAGWEDKVQRRLDRHADLAISSALCLPNNLDDLSVDDHGHRSWARLVAVGWGLARRKAGSVFEQKLLAFVQAGDAVDPKDAASHYHHLRTLPIPPKVQEVSDG